MNDLDQKQDAKEFAINAHAEAGQLYGTQPYWVHLLAVVNVIRRFGLDLICPEIIPAAWLHDVVEDTKVTIEEIEYLFGKKVAKLVLAVSKLEGKNRKEKNKIANAKMKAAGMYAVALKLCDRIANVENGGPLVSMDQEEQAEFRKSLETKGELTEVWFHLDRLLKKK